MRLLHSAWIYEGATAASIGLLTPQDVQYLWLPLSHVFGKVLLTIQLTVGFSTAVCGDVDLLVANLAVVRPTFMAGAPRIFEKVHAKVRTQLESERPAKARIAAWAMDVGRQVSVLRQRGEEPSGLLAAAARRGAPAGAVQDHRPVRRADPVLRGGLGRPEPGGRASGSTRSGS